MAKQQSWQVQTYTVCDGWINTWSDADTGKFLVFPSRKDAAKELEEFLADTVEAATRGDMAEAYRREDFRIIRTGGNDANRITKACNTAYH